MVSTEGPIQMCMPGGFGGGPQNLGLDVVLTDCFKLWEYSEQ